MEGLELDVIFAEDGLVVSDTRQQFFLRKPALPWPCDERARDTLHAGSEAVAARKGPIFSG
jgi:hypothetical protein